MRSYLDFEKPIAELEGRIDDLRGLSAGQSGTDKSGGKEVNVSEEIQKLEGKAQKLLQDTYANLSRWQKATVARHASRPHFMEYVGGLTEDFTPLAGDRVFGDDQAIIGGTARFRGRSVMIMGHEKGRDTQSRLDHNFGMARPEGYRKAMRMMEMAERFNLPVVTLVDTPGLSRARAQKNAGRPKRLPVLQKNVSASARR